MVSFRYGKVIGMYLGRFPTVVIYDFETVKELFNRDELQGRPDNFPYRFRMLGKRLGKDLVRFLYTKNLLSFEKCKTEEV